MAKLFFVGLDGTEKSYRLQTHRPFTVGRDPGNDIILRDPPPTEDIGSVPTNAHESYTPVTTQPHDKLGADDLKKKVN